MIASKDTKNKKAQNTKRASTKQDIYMDNWFYRFNNMDQKITQFWLAESSTVFFFCKQRKSSFNAKRGNNPSILIGQWSKKLTEGQSNLLLSNEARTLDGAICIGNHMISSAIWNK